jgi:RNA recognition motif-containing protein
MYEEDDDDREDEEEDPKKHRKRNYLLLVQNLTDKTSPHDLRELFSTDGEVIEVEIQLLGDMTTAKVTMPDVEASRARERLNGTRWRGRTLKVTTLSFSFD